MPSVLALLLVVALALAAAAAYSLVSAERVDPARARRLVRRGALLLDVRTPGEYAAGHLDGAINIAVDELQSRLDELGDRSRDIVVYCRSGHRSSRARRMLTRAGFKSVHNLGALAHWND